METKVSSCGQGRIPHRFFPLRATIEGAVTEREKKPRMSLPVGAGNARSSIGSLLGLFGAYVAPWDFSE